MGLYHGKKLIQSIKLSTKCKIHLLNGIKYLQTIQYIPNKGLISNIHKVLILFNIKKTYLLKNGQSSEQTFFQRRHRDAQQANRKMLNITKHQVNRSQNHNEIPPHTCQKNSDQKHKYLQELESGNIMPCWQEWKLDQPL